jgi:hypothetical protein
VDDATASVGCGTHLHVVGEELLAVGRGQGDRVLDVGALGVAAEMAVANRGVAGGIRVWGSS